MGGGLALCYSGAVRIVSFLPAATEMVYALGLGADLAGRSHECLWPKEAIAKPVLSHPALPVESMTPEEIDRAVSARMRAGESLYRIDTGLLAELAPDLILTQSLCEVCAPSGNEVTVALQSLPTRPRVLYLTPSTLAGVWDNLRELGEATGTSERAQAVIAALQSRIEAVRRRAASIGHRPRVFCMEWLDPIYNAGHWMPEMVEIAGGADDLAEAGRDSVRTPWETIREWGPEVLILTPCGFNTAQAAAQADLLHRLPGYRDLPAVRRKAVYAVDASAYFACPGPRLVDGTELLAHLIHPDIFPWTGRPDAWTTIQV
jgi:iron complex transport system substrate-binding protein